MGKISDEYAHRSSMLGGESLQVIEVKLKRCLLEFIHGVVRRSQITFGITGTPRLISHMKTRDRRLRFHALVIPRCKSQAFGRSIESKCRRRISVQP